MFGKNPLRPPEKGDGKSLAVQEIFSTLQGEGPYTGWPAIFIRLGGCNLACTFCDTEFESFKMISLSDILSEVASLNQYKTYKLVVITGGEPFRQPIEPLCTALLDQGMMVQIETNGTLYRPVDRRVDIICSPKPVNGSYYPLRKDMLSHCTALKFITSVTEEVYSAVPEVGQTEFSIPVYVQPMDEMDEMKNQANQALALELAMRYGYRLSLQTHKLVGIP